MKSEIYHRGPIVCSISTPEDFTYGYRGGIYNDPKNYTYESIDHNVEVRHQIKLTNLVSGYSLHCAQSCVGLMCGSGLAVRAAVLSEIQA